MNSSYGFMFAAMGVLVALLALIRFVDYSRRKSLRNQAGTTQIHGEAGHSLKTEKMRITKVNRDKGVIGELGVAKDLENLAHEYGLTVLHDLSVPNSTANIDHILVSRKVIYVIDAKNYTGIVKIAVNNSGKKTLRVGGRDQSALVAKAKNYAELVDAFLRQEKIRVKVLPVLAFYQAKFHEDSAHTVDGVTVNVFGIENELMRYANLKSADIDIDLVSSLILKEFPPKV